MNRRLIFQVIFLVFPVLIFAGSDCFIEIPGIKGNPGENTPEQFKDCIKPLSLNYRLPGIPRPDALLNEAPKKITGFLGADEVKHKYFSFSKLEGKPDLKLIEEYKKNKVFSQWKIFVCSDNGRPIMTFILKGVKIVKVTKRDNRQYVTVEFKRVMWNYSPPG